MTPISTQQTARDQIIAFAPYGWDHAGNMDDGVDFILPRRQNGYAEEIGRERVRVVPLCGEWDTGIEIRVLSRLGIEVSALTFSGPFDLDRTMAFVDLMAPR